MRFSPTLAFALALLLVFGLGSLQAQTPTPPPTMPPPPITADAPDWIDAPSLVRTSVPLTWDASQTAGAEYRLYVTDTAVLQDPVPLYTGTATAFEAGDLADGPHYFHVQARDPATGMYSPYASTDHPCTVDASLREDPPPPPPRPPVSPCPPPPDPASP